MKILKNTHYISSVLKTVAKENIVSNEELENTPDKCLKDIINKYEEEKEETDSE